MPVWSSSSSLRPAGLMPAPSGVALEGRASGSEGDKRAGRHDVPANPPRWREGEGKGPSPSEGAAASGHRAGSAGEGLESETAGLTGNDSAAEDLKWEGKAGRSGKGGWSGSGKDGEGKLRGGNLSLGQATGEDGREGGVRRTTDAPSPLAPTFAASGLCASKEGGRVAVQSAAAEVRQVWRSAWLQPS